MTNTNGQVLQLKDATLPDPFKPTPHMKVWIDTAINEQIISPTDISRLCGIDRTTWYKWLNLEGFIGWFLSEWNKKLKIITPALDIIGLKRARHDFKYWEAMQKRAGNLKDNDKIDIQQEMRIDFVCDDAGTPIDVK